MGSERDQAFEHRLDALETGLKEVVDLIHGKSGEQMGLVARVQIMWHSYVWMIGLLGAGIGSAVTLVVKHFI